MNEITASDIRKSHKKIKTKPCYVCGKHKGITHRHHMITLKKCAEHFNESQAENIYSPTIYLCPNCHAYVHLAMNEKLKDFTDDLVDITPNIFSKILDVVGMMKMQETCISLYSEETNVSRYQ